MAKPARATKSQTARPTRAESTAATAPAPAPKTASLNAAGPEKKPVEKPAAAPAETSARRGRPPGNGQPAKKRGRKAKNARQDILFLVETGEESNRYELQPVAAVADLLDLMDENRRVIASRAWREF